jgi:hypothetical protein
MESFVRRKANMAPVCKKARATANSVVKHLASLPDAIEQYANVDYYVCGEQLEQLVRELYISCSSSVRELTRNSSAGTRAVRPVPFHPSHPGQTGGKPTRLDGNN